MKKKLAIDELIANVIEEAFRITSGVVLISLTIVVLKLTVTGLVVLTT